VLIPPRQRRLPTTSRVGPGAGDASGSDGYRPTATGAFPRHRSTPAGTAPMGSLPDAVAIVRDEDNDAPKGDVL
jgi:hypothetical protein